MIETRLVETVAASEALPAPRPAAQVRPPGRARKYELSDALRAFLQTKYSSAPAIEGMPPAIRPTFELATRCGGGERTRPPGAGTISARVHHHALVVARLLVLAAMSVALGAVAFGGAAHADTLEFQQGGFFTGTQADQFSFTSSSAGTLNVALSDLDGSLDTMLGWPVGSTQLTSLTFTLWSSTQILESCSLAAPCQPFNIGGAGTYYGEIEAVAGSNPFFPGLNFGADGAIGEFAPVPLPASAWLLLAGVGATFWSVRRRRGAAEPPERARPPERVAYPAGPRTA
ncbi:MAG TPA: VPLPA-CTERM sorting domain-containing protein [Steroidobacteraceae bacterium]|nr:VPLPA-CTERM sorting domain-containing protein [Steroidobacteraceae bacterium]